MDPSASRGRELSGRPPASCAACSVPEPPCRAVGSRSSGSGFRRRSTSACCARRPCAGSRSSRCVRDRLEAHLALEEELLDVVERKDASRPTARPGARFGCASWTSSKSVSSRRSAARRSRSRPLVADLRARGVGRRPALRRDDRLPRAQGGAGPRHAEEEPRRASAPAGGRPTYRLWQDGGPVFAPDEADGEKPAGG